MQIQYESKFLEGSSRENQKKERIYEKTGLHVNSREKKWGSDRWWEWRQRLRWDMIRWTPWTSRRVNRMRLTEWRRKLVSLVRWCISKNGWGFVMRKIQMKHFEHCKTTDDSYQNYCTTLNVCTEGAGPNINPTWLVATRLSLFEPISNLACQRCNEAQL